MLALFKSNFDRSTHRTHEMANYFKSLKNKTRQSSQINQRLQATSSAAGTVSIMSSTFKQTDPMSHVSNNQGAVRNAIIVHMSSEMFFEWLNHFFKLLTKKLNQESRVVA